MSLVSLLMPEGELRVIRCDTADKLIQCGNGDAALLYQYYVRGHSSMSSTPCAT